MDTIKTITDAIDRLFADTRVTPRTTKDRLRDIKEHIEMLMDTLED